MIYFKCYSLSREKRHISTGQTYFIPKLINEGLMKNVQEALFGLALN